MTEETEKDAAPTDDTCDPDDIYDLDGAELQAWDQYACAALSVGLKAATAASRADELLLERRSRTLPRPGWRRDNGNPVKGKAFLIGGYTKGYWMLQEKQKHHQFRAVSFSHALQRADRFLRDGWPEKDEP